MLFFVQQDLMIQRGEGVWVALRSAYASSHFFYKCTPQQRRLSQQKHNSFTCKFQNEVQ